MYPKTPFGVHIQARLRYNLPVHNSFSSDCVHSVAFFVKSYLYQGGLQAAFLPAPETLLVLDFAFLTGELFVLSLVVLLCPVGRSGGVLLELLELAAEGAGHSSGLSLPDFAEEERIQSPVKFPWRIRVFFSWMNYLSLRKTH